MKVIVFDPIQKASSFASMQRVFLLVICSFVTMAITAIGQTSYSNVQLANLRSDLDRLDQIVRRLQLDVEALNRENRQLRETVSSQLDQQKQQYVTMGQMREAFKDFERNLQQSNRKGKEALVKEVSKEIETLAEQTQKAINALAKSIEGQPQLEQVVVFNDNYPRNGAPYTVKAGDSLGKIAREQKSKVEWIKNANRLSTDIIYPGQELFIPQED